MIEEIYNQILAEKFKSNPDWNKIRKLQQLSDSTGANLAKQIAINYMSLKKGYKKMPVISKPGKSILSDNASLKKQK